MQDCEWYYDDRPSAPQRRHTLAGSKRSRHHAKLADAEGDRSAAEQPSQSGLDPLIKCSYENQSTEHGIHKQPLYDSLFRRMGRQESVHAAEVSPACVPTASCFRCEQQRLMRAVKCGEIVESQAPNDV